MKIIGYSVRRDVQVQLSLICILRGNDHTNNFDVDFITFNAFCEDDSNQQRVLNIINFDRLLAAYFRNGAL